MCTFAVLFFHGIDNKMKIIQKDYWGSCTELVVSNSSKILDFCFGYCHYAHCGYSTFA